MRISDWSSDVCSSDLLMDQGVSLQAMQLEMRVQRLCSQIERNGWPFDRKAAEELYATLCAERENLSQSLRSLFPLWEVQLEDFVPKRNNKTKGYIAGEIGRAHV